jgi:hypothetical protein
LTEGELLEKSQALNSIKLSNEWGIFMFGKETRTPRSWNIKCNGNPIPLKIGIVFSTSYEKSRKMHFMR